MNEQLAKSLPKQKNSNKSQTSKALAKKLEMIKSPISSKDASSISMPMAHPEYEHQLRYLEQECRNHIKCEQQMKLHIECLQDKFEQSKEMEEVQKIIIADEIRKRDEYKITINQLELKIESLSDKLKKQEDENKNL